MCQLSEADLSPPSKPVPCLKACVLHSLLPPGNLSQGCLCMRPGGLKLWGPLAVRSLARQNLH